MRRSLGTVARADVLFPIHEFLKGHSSVRLRRTLEDRQWWPRERLLAERDARLRSFLTRVGRRVPYYARLFASTRFDPRRTDGVAALARLPLLTKGIVRDQRSALTAEGARDLRPFNTGGSTGEPLQFLLSPERVSHDVAARWRVLRWWGVDIGDPEIVFWGSPIELDRQDRLRSIRDRVLRSRLISAFDLTPDRMDAALRVIRHDRPSMLFGYPSVIARLARRAERIGTGLDGLGIRAVFVTAEMLWPADRAVMERVFGCPVANGYGGRDAGFVAHECPDGGMHLAAEHVIAEVVDEAGCPLPPGVPGEIVVTHLATGHFPFIRYRTGDRGRLSEAACPCGRGLPLLEAIEGRSTDFLTATDGSPVHALAVLYALREIPELESFQVVQDERLRVRVRAVAPQGLPEARRAALRAALVERLGTGMRVEIETLGAIDVEPNGKYRFVRNLLPTRETDVAAGRAGEAPG